MSTKDDRAKYGGMKARRSLDTWQTVNLTSKRVLARGDKGYERAVAHALIQSRLVHYYTHQMGRCRGRAVCLTNCHEAKSMCSEFQH